MRTCAVCREVRAKRSMTRMVRSADGTIVQDATGKAAGRGTYVCDEPSCQEPQRLAQAVGRALGAAMKPGTLAAKEKHATT
jgi:predicted RNA-binding protein YlxR (DUF448 family)